MALTVTTTIDDDILISTADQRLIDIASAALAMNVVVALSRISFKRASGPPDSHHEYVITTLDGRQWFQDVQTIDASTSYLMTFSVPDQWDLREIMAQRSIRDNLVSLDREFGVAQIVIAFS